MALVLVKEDGSGKSNANTYALAADADAYHEAHLYASAWTGAIAGDKDKALVMATRLIDSQFQFAGFKRLNTQALQWPRFGCPDRDLSGQDAVLDETKVPALVVQATCELARELLKQDRTDDPDGEGLRSLRIDGALRLEFEPKDRQPLVSRVVQLMLAKVGDYLGASSGAVRLVRT